MKVVRNILKNRKFVGSGIKIGCATLFVITILLCVTTVTNAQESDKVMKLRLAQGFDEAGEWERAVLLYEELYKSEPNNYIFIDALQRDYAQIKEYDKAIRVIRTYLTFQPRDINMMTRLGGIYYESGAEAIADSVWKSVFATNPNNMQLYRIVANEMMEHRLYDRCIRMYLDGRSVNKTDALFADELGMLYTALQQYSSATQEYLRLIKVSPDQLSFVQSRLSGFTNRPEALHAILEKVGGEVKLTPNNITLRRLYAWLLTEDQKYDLALEQYRNIDKLSNANGNELFSYAQRLNQERVFDVAAKGFKEIVDQYKNPSLLPYARFGYARALEELISRTDTIKSFPNTSIGTSERESQTSYSGVIQLYESIVAAHFNLDLTAQSIFRIGVIKFEKIFDLDGALTAFNRIKELPPSSNILNDAVLKIGDIQIARNNISDARKEYTLLSRMPQTVYQDQASFKLAELYYFEAQFDSAFSMLKHFNANPNTDLTNDALQLQYFIQENKTSAPQALTEFAKADLLIRQRKYSEALLQFQGIIKQYPAALLEDDATMKIGELHLYLKQPIEAIAAFRFVADSIQLSILKDRALFCIAETLQNVINNKVQAIDAYEKLLTQFPNSLYAEETRKRIRILRGDIL